MEEMPISDNLCNASAKGNLSEVQLGLQNGAQVNGFNIFLRTPLQVVQVGSTDVVEVLLEAGGDPNLPDPACGRTVLHDAAEGGFWQTVRVLVNHGADANLADFKDNLPLHLAAREGHLKVVQIILGCTANPRAANDEGQTAQQLAQGEVRTAIEEYLNAN